MSVIYTLHESIDYLLRQGFYTSLPTNRARVQSLLAGAILGLGQTLPAENILRNKERFFYDLVDPALQRFTRQLSNKHITSTPTLRTMTHAMVDMRLALAHNPTLLNNPIESLSWITAKQEVPLFKDSTLEVFKKLNISPFDIEIKHLFKAFVEADGNLYQTTMDGIHAYHRRSFTRVNGTQIPLPSITEEELSIIAGGYLGILIAYILPIPVTPADKFDIHWVTQILPQVYSLVDQFNERAIMDVAHIEKVAKAIYFNRYSVVHAVPRIAHNLVYLLLTNTTTSLPPALLEGMNENLRDQIADDTRDVLEKAFTMVETDELDSLGVALPDRFDFVELDNAVLEAIDRDMALVHSLQDAYSRGALSESDVVSLEHLHARYYNYTATVPGISLEDVRGGRYHGLSVSTEGAGLIIFGALAAAITAAIMLAINAIMSLFTGTKQVSKNIDIVADTNKYINNMFTQINQQANRFSDAFAEYGKHFDEVIAALEEQETQIAKSMVVRLLNAVRRYNPQAKIPKLDVFGEGLMWILQNMNTQDKITALLFTRGDNSQVPQVSKAFSEQSRYNTLLKHTNASMQGIYDTVDAMSDVADETIVNRIITELKSGDQSRTLTAFSAETKTFSENLAVHVNLATEIVNDTTAVNQTKVWELVSKDASVLKELFREVETRSDVATKFLKNLKTKQDRTLKIIEDAVKSGKIDDKKGKQINDVYRERVRVCRESLVKIARMGGALLKQEMIILRFSKDFKTLVTDVKNSLDFVTDKLNNGVEFTDE